LEVTVERQANEIQEQQSQLSKTNLKFVKVKQKFIEWVNENAELTLQLKAPDREYHGHQLQSVTQIDELRVTIKDMTEARESHQSVISDKREEIG
jgi:hypothetical protein